MSSDYGELTRISARLLMPKKLNVIYGVAEQKSVSGAKLERLLDDLKEELRVVACDVIAIADRHRGGNNGR